MYERRSLRRCALTFAPSLSSGGYMIQDGHLGHTAFECSKAIVELADMNDDELEQFSAQLRAKFCQEGIEKDANEYI